jgi:hypothetical protein
MPKRHVTIGFLSVFTCWLQWTIKAKLVRKAPPRSFNSRAGTPSRVFNVELADAAVSDAAVSVTEQQVEAMLDVCNFLPAPL